MILYKYADWTNKYTKENLRSCKLGFNTPENFNDPFDTFPCYSIDNRNNFYTNLIKKMLEHPKLQLHNFDNEIYFKKIYNLIQEASNEDLIILQGIVDKSNMYNSRYGITCFSKTAKNILMWSHYANKHRGICLGFDIPEKCIIDFFDDENIPSALKGKLLEIEYTDKRYCWDISKENQENISALLSSKYTVWEYEQEFRIFLRSDDLFTFPTGLKYKLNHLKEIILGLNMTLKDYIDFYNIKKGKFPNLPIKISNLSQNEYELETFPLSQEEQINLFNNYSFLKQNIPETVVNNYPKIKSKKLKGKWQDSIDELPLYAIKTYWNTLFFKQDLSSRISPKTYDPNNKELNDIYKISSFINFMQDNIDYKLKE